ncbi:MAG: hypothetical protein GF411_13550 [Candidatus Lokiarchaeota archaeon]|nr:hypothetical protein [Candidatus Lokiarchaeota archaeon]
MLRKKWILFGINLLIIMILSSGCIDTDNDEEESTYENNENLSIKIIPSDPNVQYNLSLPILINNGKITPLIENIAVKKGNATFIVEDSKYGKVFTVNSHDTVVLEANNEIIDKEMNEEFMNYLWTTDPESEVRSSSVYLYCESNSENSFYLNVEIIFQAKSDLSNRYSKFGGKVTGNHTWQSISGIDDAESD